MFLVKGEIATDFRNTFFKFDTRINKLKNNLADRVENSTDQ
jgi:hypothetical protein